MEIENTRTGRRRNDSRASLSRLQSSVQSFTRAKEKLQAESPLAKSTTLSRGRSRLKIPNSANDSKNLQGRRPSESSQDGYGSQHPAFQMTNSHERRESLQSSQGGASSVISDFTAETVGSREIPNRSTDSRSQGELLYRPTKTQLLRDADIFYHLGTQKAVKGMMRNWRVLALQNLETRSKLDQIAVSYDANELLRQGFAEWRLRLLIRRRAQETERFFSRLEERASKARDYYLLSKAFSHWAQCASDEILRTSVARRHILRTKYFNAWLEITAVNELKVRRQGLKKFFQNWKKQSHLVAANRNNAIILYEENLVRRTYWIFFWSFCDRRAPRLTEPKLGKRYLFQWRRRLHIEYERDEETHISWEKRLLKKHLCQWLEKTRIILSGTRQASLFRSQNLVARCVPEWRTKLRYIPLAQQISNLIDWRVARSTFINLLTKVKLERQAAAVNRSRLLRNSWTCWNDRLRWQTLAHRIDDRLVLQALYKWILWERFSLLRRLHERRVKQEMLSRLLSQRASLHSQYASRVWELKRFADRRRLAAAFGRWKLQLDLYHQRERLAFEYQAPHSIQVALQIWLSRSAQVQRLNSWSKDAEFYFRISKSLKCWQKAVSESRRQKRRNAYALVRRRVKMKLARDIIHKWHRLALNVLDFEQIATNTYQRKISDFSMAIFGQWGERFRASIDLLVQANQHRRNQTLSQKLQKWTESLRMQSQMEEQADALAGVHVLDLAFGCLRRLQLRAFELSRREETAESFRQRNEKRHFRSLLKHWLSKTTQGGEQSNPPLIRSSKSRRIVPGASVHGGEGLVERAEGWTEYGEDDDFDIGDWIPAPGTRSNPTPIPGYLSTPSKRAARARALVKAPITPSTPVGTPFGRGLNSQLAASRRPPRSGIGNSGLSRSRTVFGDDSEG